jgi:hypothetical protein
MQLIRRRAGLVAGLVLAWQVFALAAVSTALCCGMGEPRAAVEQTAPTGHAGHAMPAADHSAHAGMATADTPMQEAAAPACPRHPDGRECDCPSMGCASTETGLMALFGAVGILSAPLQAVTPLIAGDAAPIVPPAGHGLAPVPVAPPPRS